MTDPLLIQIFRSNQLQLINSYNKFFSYYGINLNTCTISEFIRTRDGMNSIFKFLKDCNIANGSPKIPNDTINDLNVSSHVRLKHKQKRKWKSQNKDAVKNLSIEWFIPRTVKDHGALSAYFGLVNSILGISFDEDSLDVFYHQIWYDCIVPFMLDHLNWMNSLEGKNNGIMSNVSDYNNASTSIKELSYDLNNKSWLINGIIRAGGLIDKINLSIDNEIDDCIGFLLGRGVIVLSPIDQENERILFDKTLLLRGDEKILLTHELNNKHRYMFIYTILSNICEWCHLSNNQNVNFNSKLGVYPMIDKDHEKYGLFIGLGENLKPFQNSSSIDSQILIPILFETSENIRCCLSNIVERIFSTQSARNFIPCIVVDESSIMIYFFHRSGGFFSESIDFIIEPLKVCKLFLSLLFMDEESMGFDTSLRIDRKIPFKQFVYWTHPRNGIEYCLNDMIIKKDPFGSSICIRQIAISDEVNTSETMFLKTFWQEISERRNSMGIINQAIPNEVSIYQIATENRVRFIPKCIDFGYTYYPNGQLQDTNSIYYKYLSTDETIRFKNRVNNWMLLSVPGKPSPLYGCKNLQDIFICLRDIIIAHWDLYKAGILHRNICKENLWIIKNDNVVSGLLGGLELSLHHDKGECEANYKTDRRYLAINLLKKLESHQFIHDLESIFWWIIIEAFPIETSTWEYLYFTTLASRKEEFLNNFINSPKVYNTIHPFYKPALPYILELKNIIFDIAGRASFDERWMYDEVEQTLIQASLDSKVQKGVLVVDEEDGIIEMNEW